MAVKVLKIKAGVLDENNRKADQLREELRAKQQVLINLMSSPGSGKTTTLLRTLQDLQGEIRMAVMEADIDSAVDAEAIAKTGTPVIQLHTGGMCHLDAEMTRQGLEGLAPEAKTQLIFLENVGNLVCPAEFDTGATKNIMILSVPEGDDKPLKYPLMFTIVDLILVNKMDVQPYFSFDLEKFTENVRLVNPQAQILPISSLKGEGMEAFYHWLREQVR